jgi:hypothetical protein
MCSYIKHTNEIELLDMMLSERHMTLGLKKLNIQHCLCPTVKEEVYIIAR